MIAHLTPGRQRVLYRYVRHSVDCKDQPNSREAQLRAINNWIAAQAAEGEVYLDGGEFYDADVSGTTEFRRRPAGSALMGRVQPGDVIVAAKWDRMFRNVRDGVNTMFELQQRNISVVGLNFKFDTRVAAGQFATTLMLAVGEFERQCISDRTRETLSIIKYNKGVNISYSCRLGWKRVRKHQQTRKDGQPYAVVEPWWEERKECERIVHMHEVRGMSFGEIAVFCNKNGEVSVQGAEKGKQKGEEKWSYMMVRKRYLAAKAMYPRRSYDDETGQNSEVLMVPAAIQ